MFFDLQHLSQTFIYNGLKDIVVDMIDVFEIYILIVLNIVSLVSFDSPLPIKAKKKDCFSIKKIALPLHDKKISYEK